MVKVGIIGLGFMSVAHIRAYQQIDDVDIVAICNPSGRRLDGDLSDVFGNVGDQEPVRLDMTTIKGYQSVDDFLAHPGMQMVDICTPTTSHLGLVEKALQAQKHVLCEKPLCLHSDEALKMLALSEQASTFLMPAMCLRFWPEWKYLKDAIDEGRYGKILSTHFVRIGEAPGWSSNSYLDGSKSGGALLDLHIHDSDFVQYCFGKPTSVFSSGFSKVSGAIDHVISQYEVSSGVCVSAEGSWAMSPGFGFEMAYKAVFESATIDYSLGRGEEALKVFANDKDPEVVKLGQPDGYVGEIRHLAECIRTNTPPHVVTPREGVQAIQICEAEAKSIASRQPQSIL